MIGHRTRHSLVQLLEQQDPQVVVVILNKYAAGTSLTHGQALFDILNCVLNLDETTILHVMAEVIGTSGDLRTRVNPKYRFDERMHDLTQCLALDGYAIEGKRLVQTDPSIADLPPIDDDLVEALKNCAAPRRLDVIQKINDSAEAFRASPPDYNASLVNARVAMETLASDAAMDLVPAGTAPTFDSTKWGEVVAFLRKSGEISVEEEAGLVGVFRFLSPGAHRPMGVPEVQTTRLGRSFALNMCWFLLQNHLAPRQ